MANQLHPEYLDLLLQDFLDTDYSWVLLDDTYTLDLDAHVFLDDVDPGAIIAITDPVAGKTVAGGVADHSDLSVVCPSGRNFTQAWLVRGDTGTPATCRLAAYVDRDDSGVPILVVTDGTPVTLNVSGSVTRAFRI